MLLNIVVGDHHLHFLHQAEKTLCQLLNTHFKFQVLACTWNGSAALAAIRDTQPQLALLALNLPEHNALQIAQASQVLSPQTQIIICSCQTQQVCLEDLLTARISGYLLKDRLDRLPVAVKCILQQQVYFEPEVLQNAYQKSLNKHLIINENLISSPFETRLLDLLSQGLTQGQMVKALNMNLNTLKSHLRQLRLKYQCSSLNELRLKLNYSQKDMGL